MIAPPELSPLSLAIRRTGHSQRAVAKAAHISESYLSLLCNGHKKPSPLLAAFLGILLDTPAEELFPGLEDGAR